MSSKIIPFDNISLTSGRTTCRIPILFTTTWSGPVIIRIQGLSNTGKTTELRQRRLSPSLLSRRSATALNHRVYQPVCISIRLCGMSFSILRSWQRIRPGRDGSLPGIRRTLRRIRLGISGSTITDTPFPESPALLIWIISMTDTSRRDPALRRSREKCPSGFISNFHFKKGAKNLWYVLEKNCLKLSGLWPVTR